MNAGKGPTSDWTHADHTTKFEFKAIAKVKGPGDRQTQAQILVQTLNHSQGT